MRIVSIGTKSGSFRRREMDIGRGFPANSFSSHRWLPGFGSSTHDPSDLYSYKPAILSPQGTRELSPDLLREDGNYVEPLDGTQNGPWITFLGRQISSSSTGDHQEDNAFPRGRFTPGIRMSNVYVP